MNAYNNFMIMIMIKRLEKLKGDMTIDSTVLPITERTEEFKANLANCLKI